MQSHVGHELRSVLKPYSQLRLGGQMMGSQAEVTYEESSERGAPAAQQIDLLETLLTYALHVHSNRSPRCLDVVVERVEQFTLSAEPSDWAKFFPSGPTHQQTFPFLNN